MGSRKATPKIRPPARMSFVCLACDYKTDVHINYRKHCKTERCKMKCECYELTKKLNQVTAERDDVTKQVLELKATVSALQVESTKLSQVTEEKTKQVSEMKATMSSLQIETRRLKHDVLVAKHEAGKELAKLKETHTNVLKEWRYHYYETHYKHMESQFNSTRLAEQGRILEFCNQHMHPIIGVSELIEEAVQSVNIETPKLENMFEQSVIRFNELLNEMPFYGRPLIYQVQQQNDDGLCSRKRKANQHQTFLIANYDEATKKFGWSKLNEHDFIDDILRALEQHLKTHDIEPFPEYIKKIKRKDPMFGVKYEQKTRLNDSEDFRKTEIPRFYGLINNGIPAPDANRKRWFDSWFFEQQCR